MTLIEFIVVLEKIKANEVPKVGFQLHEGIRKLIAEFGIDGAIDFLKKVATSDFE